MASRPGRSSSRWTRCDSRRASRTRRPRSPPQRASNAPPTRKSAMRSSSCSRARCRPPPKSSTSSSPRCCGIRSSSCGPTAMPSALPMRLSADALNRFGEALCRELGARGPATSPTYALVHQHPTPDSRLVYHVDCYRLRSPAEAQDLGFEDMVRDRAIVLIEWPERAGPWLPPLQRHFKLAYDADPELRVVEEA